MTQSTYSNVPKREYVERAKFADNATIISNAIYIDVETSTSGTLDSDVLQQILSNTFVIFVCNGLYYYKAKLNDNTLTLCSTYPIRIVVDAKTDIIEINVNTGVWQHRQVVVE